MADTIKSESDLLDVFKDAQKAGSITANDVRDLVVSSKHLNTQGWQFHLDGLYTEASPFALLAGVRHQITIDGVLETSGHPIDPSATPSLSFWNVTTNKVEPSGLNDFGFVRLAFTGASVGAGANRIEVELDVSALPNGTGSPMINGDIIFQQTVELVKGAGVQQFFNFTIPLFAGPNFQTNGGIFYITAVGDVNIWLKAITTSRLYTANPTA